MKRRTRSKILDWTFLLAIVAGSAATANLENTLGGVYLFCWSAIFGALSGFCLAWWLVNTKNVDPQFYASKKGLYGICIISCVCFMSFIMSSANRFLPSSARYRKPSIVAGKELSQIRRAPFAIYRLKVLVNENEEYVLVSEEIWERVEQGDTVNLAMRSGFFGYPFIYLVEPLTD